MYHNIPNIGQASLCDRTDGQKLARTILKIEGIKSLNMMYREFS